MREDGLKLRGGLQILVSNIGVRVALFYLSDDLIDIGSMPVGSPNTDNRKGNIFSQTSIGVGERLFIVKV